MIELYQMGGVLFMSILTIELTIVILLAVRGVFRNENSAKSVKSVGLLAAITGVLGQLIGLFSAFETIQEMGSVSPSILAGGLKVSMITTLYGLVIYIISLILSLGLAFRSKVKGV